MSIKLRAAAWCLCCTVVGLLLVALPLAARAADELKPEAREAFDKGVRAAGQQDYTLAIRYFEKARQAAPLSPQVLFNIGLAGSRVPGRELRSMAFLRLYLETVPDAPKAGQVRDLIADLEIKVESTLGKLIGQANQAAGQFADKQDKDLAYSDVAQAYGGIEDFGNAKAAASRSDNYRSTAYQKIAILQAESGDIPGARSTLEKSGGEMWKVEGLAAIAKALYKKGEKDEAHRTLAETLDFIAGKKSDSGKDIDYLNVGVVQAGIGDMKGALRSADLDPAPIRKDQIYYAMCFSNDLKDDDLALMENVASRMKYDYDREQCLKRIGEARSPAKTNPEEIKAAGMRKKLATLTGLIDDTEKPLYTDFPNYLQSVSRRTAASSTGNDYGRVGWKSDAEAIFHGLSDTIRDLSQMLKRIKQTEADLAQ